MTANPSATHRFEKLVARGVTLVDFNAPWCGPCRDLAPIVKTLGKRFRGAARVKFVDVEKDRDVALELGIQSIPTIILFKDGREMKRFIGLQSGETLSKALKAMIR